MEKKELIKNSDSYGFFQKIKNYKIIIIALIIAIALIAILVLSYKRRIKIENIKKYTEDIRDDLRMIKEPLKIFLGQIFEFLNIYNEKDKKETLLNSIKEGKKLCIQKNLSSIQLSINKEVVTCRANISENFLKAFGASFGALYVYYQKIIQDIENIEKNKTWGYKSEFNYDKRKKELDSILDNIVIKKETGTNEETCEYSMKSLFLLSKGEFINKIYSLDLFSSGFIEVEEIKQGMKCSRLMLNEISATKKNKCNEKK